MSHIDGTNYIFHRNIECIDSRILISLSELRTIWRIHVQQNHWIYYETDVENTLFALAFIYNTSIRLYLLCELWVPTYNLKTLTIHIAAVGRRVKTNIIILYSYGAPTSSFKPPRWRLGTVEISVTRAIGGVSTGTIPL